MISGGLQEVTIDLAKDIIELGFMLFLVGKYVQSAKLNVITRQ